MNIMQFNYCEAVLWIALALALFIAAIKHKERTHQNLLLTAAATFVVFSISDLIEARTGAWWRPPGLLILKVLCLIVFVVIYRKYKTIEKGSS